jgi:hypothetical protein
MSLKENTPYLFYGVDNNYFKVAPKDSGLMEVYEVMEDEEDGYRSRMKDLREVPPQETFKLTFFREPIDTVRFVEDVVATGDSPGTDCLDHLVSTKDGHVWLEFGTKNVGDYYPSFWFHYEPRDPAQPFHQNQEQLKHNERFDVPLLINSPRVSARDHRPGGPLNPLPKNKETAPMSLKTRTLYKFYGVDKFDNRFKVAKLGPKRPVPEVYEVVDEATDDREEDGKYVPDYQVRPVPKNDASDMTFSRTALDTVEYKKEQGSLELDRLVSASDGHVWLEFGVQEVDEWEDELVFEYFPRGPACEEAHKMMAANQASGPIGPLPRSKFRKTSGASLSDLETKVVYKFYGVDGKKELNKPTRHFFKVALDGSRTSAVYEVAEDADNKGYYFCLPSKEEAEGNLSFHRTYLDLVEFKENQGPLGLEHLVSVADGHSWLEFGMDNGVWPSLVFAYHPRPPKTKKKKPASLLVPSPSYVQHRADHVVPEFRPAPGCLTCEEYQYELAHGEPPHGKESKGPVVFYDEDGRKHHELSKAKSPPNDHFPSKKCEIKDCRTCQAIANLDKQQDRLLSVKQLELLKASKRKEEDQLDHSDSPLKEPKDHMVLSAHQVKKLKDMKPKKKKKTEPYLKIHKVSHVKSEEMELVVGPLQRTVIMERRSDENVWRISKRTDLSSLDPTTLQTILSRLEELVDQPISCPWNPTGG